MGRFALVSSVGGSIGTLVPILVLVAGGGANGYALAILVTFILTLVVSWRTSNIRLPRLRISPRALLTLLPAGLPFLGWNLTMQFYGQIDRILLGVLAPVQVVGWYAAASRVIGVPIFIPLLIVTPLFPALTRCKDDSAVFRDTLNKSMRVALLLTAPLCAATAAVAPVIPSLLRWPDSFNESIVPMTILAPNLAIVAFDMMLGTALLALGLERKWLVVGVVAAVVNPTLNMFAIPLTQATWGNGGIGAAMVTVTTECVMLVGALILMPRGLLDRSLLHIAARMFIAGAAFVAVTRILSGAPLPVSVAIASGALAFVVSVVLLKLIDMNDVRQLQGFARHLVQSRTR
jgi:O-antigen/teichoic acid export membrane protein